MRKSSSLALIVAAVTAAAMTTGSAGGASRVAASSMVSPAAAENALAYWTPRRMANAKPYNVHPAARVESPGSASRGQVVSVPPVVGALGTNGAATTAATPVARPYEELPDRLNAKIFFTKATGGNFVCSGTIVNSATKRMVSTAGHCVSDGLGRFHLNVIVVPGYASDCVSPSPQCHVSRPFGTWTARQLTVLDDWHRFSNFKQDVGYVVVNDLAGERIVNRLGGQGSRFNALRSQQFLAYGYPAAAPFHGQDQLVCPSGRVADDNPSPRPGPLTIQISCDMTGGASGGGWIVNQGAAGLGQVNSVNSYKKMGLPNNVYGPYFGNEALDLFNFTVGLG